MVQALWLYRRFVWSMVVREFRARYMGSLLGALWAVLTPLATILIYLLIFANVMRGKLPRAGQDSLSYAIFLCTGILIWGYFAEVVTRCQTVFVENANLMKKMSFPRITLPAISLLTATVNFALVSALFVVVLAVVGRLPGSSAWALVPLLLLQQALAVGLGILLGTLHVFFRDIGQLWSVVLNLWFWITPIVYHVDILPESTRPLIQANPLTPLYRAFQDLILTHSLPEWSTLTPTAILAGVALSLGLISFRKLSGEMVDEL